MLQYRLEKVARLAGIAGAWLDIGCADGYYALGLAERGAASVVGVEVDSALVTRAASLPHPPSVSYRLGAGERLPFDDGTFDGVLLNEVLEHAKDDAGTLSEVARVLRPGGLLALFSPNRWFPFEGHGARWSEDLSLAAPVPLMPWLPKRLTNRVATARNYWPGELVRLVRNADLRVEYQGWALAQFEQYPWLPSKLTDRYRRNLEAVEASAVARLFAVSTFILARR